MNRRQFFSRLALTFGSVSWGYAQTSPALGEKKRGLVGGGCDGCEAIFQGLPAKLSPETTLAPKSEPGERLEVSGTVFRIDGTTPAPGIILYLWHTDAKGIYVPAEGQTGHARRHGKLRGWLQTDARGGYKFETIRPAAYPRENIPAHVHVVVKEPDKNEYYLEDFLFDDDPLLTTAARKALDGRGGSGILKMQKSAGRWLGRRDIILGRNIPNY